MLFSPIARFEYGEYACRPMRKPVAPMADLETRIMNRLQLQRQGQTIEELQKYLDEPQGRILAVLVPLKAEAFVATPKSGVWTIVREACSVPPRSLQC